MTVDLEPALRELHEAAFGWALICCRFDRAEAEDVLQSCYLKALDGRARYGGRAPLRTWWFGVVRRTAQERRRSVLRRLQLLSEHWDASATEGAPTGAVPADPRTAWLREALTALPARQREMLHLVFYQELTVEEAAAVLKLRLGTARTHYARGKRNLRARLERRAPQEMET
jgi:RNA polymerase sigma-70 factor (ECF subfamily)